MEQCLSFLMKNASNTTSKPGKSYLLFTKEATHSLYHKHHHYILHHIFTYSYKFNQTDMQRVSGKLTLIDELGASFPCDFLTLTLIDSEIEPRLSVSPNKNGEYYINYRKKSPIENFSILLKEYPNFNNFSFLPRIQLCFPENTTIDHCEFSFTESPFVLL